MRNLQFILVLVLMSASLFAESSFAKECLHFYTTTAVARRPPVSERIAAKMKSTPNALAELLISDVLKDDIADLQSNYLAMIEGLSTKGRTNPITWVLESTNATLTELRRISKSIEEESLKGKQNEVTMTSLAQDLQRCSSNIATCKANLLPAIENSARRIREAMTLVSQLSERVQDVERLLNEPGAMSEIPSQLHEPALRGLQAHRQLISNYILGIEATLAFFKNSELVLKNMAPELVAAENEIVVLQSIVTSVKSKSKIFVEAVGGYPKFAKLFEAPVQETAFGSLVKMWTEQYRGHEPGTRIYLSESNFFKMMQDIETKIQIHPHLKRYAHASEVKALILKILRDPQLLKHHEQFAPAPFSVNYLLKGGKMLEYNTFWWADLHLPLMFIEGNGPHLYKENLVWLYETIEAVKVEIQNKPKSWKDYFSKEQQRHLKNLQHLADTYRNELEQDHFNTLYLSRKKYSASEVTGIFISSKVPLQNSYTYTFEK
ncbi:MAG: hypothetical protein JNL11_09625 [Bdellovibrionaceae bacterium]|nr:hypothetical protein [Pseudobdellovibrionaceae bacterium]